MNNPRNFCIIASLFAATACSAQALSILGLTTGMSTEQARQVVKNFECVKTKNDALGDEKCRIFSDRNSSIQYGGATATYVVAYFYEDALATAIVSFKEQNFTPIVNGLQSKYGPPTDQTVKPIINRLGATFESKELVWSLGGDTLNARQRVGKIDESQVRLQSQNAPVEFERRSQEKAKTTASQL